ncbi:hypothetical protein [Streptomyces olivaceiscleroticus]|uniref:Uncharacterized protein n=1 Tax=Streptomyces olivaceiscleroticus TaxID=68245 RepID=A0ABN1BEZ5_9ACTN
MPAPASRAQDIAARLAAADYKPRLSRFPGHIRIEVSVPDAPSEASWRFLLTALERADRFGLEGGADGFTAWAVVWAVPHSRATPGEAPRGKSYGPPRPREGRPDEVDENRK